MSPLQQKLFITKDLIGALLHGCRFQPRLLPLEIDTELPQPGPFLLPAIDGLAIIPGKIQQAAHGILLDFLLNLLCPCSKETPGKNFVFTAEPAKILPCCLDSLQNFR